MGIFINKVKVKNYKCWADKDINLKAPDGTLGSGLNILIGENGNGKTSILECINYLTLGTYSIENTLNINDFTDFKKDIDITAETGSFKCRSSIEYFKDWTFESKGIAFNVKSRDEKERGKLLSSIFDVSKKFIPVENHYKKDNGDTAVYKDGQVRSIDGRDLLFENSRIIEDELNIFFFDKNRSRQISTGNYKTTFEKICDDLNWNFVKNITDENKGKLLENISGEFFRTIDTVTDKGVGKKTATDLKDFFGNEIYDKLKIELLEILHPFTRSFFALRNDDALTQVSVKDLGSGIEIILTLLLLKNIAGASKGSIVYLIDEPELHLHPKAQEKLLNLLLDEAKTKQIIISTHSPYLFKGAISQNANLMLFTRNDKNEIIVSDARDNGWGLFPNWSPSWGEINYFAYDMPTIEFHDELYGFLQEKYISDAASQEEANTRSSIKKFDEEYLQNSVKEKKDWTPEFGGIAQDTLSVSLPTFIRNKIHHPENKTMKTTDYSPKELHESIKIMIDLVRNSNS